MSQSNATGVDTDKRTTRRPPWPDALMGDSEQSEPAYPDQRPRNSDAIRVGTEVPRNQCRGDTGIVCASPIICA